MRSFLGWASKGKRSQAETGSMNILGKMQEGEQGVHQAQQGLWEELAGGLQGRFQKKARAQGRASWGGCLCIHWPWFLNSLS